MLHFNWPTVFYVVAIAALAYWQYWSRRRSADRWIADLATTVNGKRAGKNVIHGERDGLVFRIVAMHLSNRPSWMVELPDVHGPSFAIREEGRSDRFFKRLGLAKETQLSDAALDKRLWITAPKPESLSAYLSTPVVAEALSRLFREGEAHHDGQVRWLQSGERLQAMIDVANVSERDFDERVELLLRRVFKTAIALRATPVPEGADRTPMSSAVLEPAIEVQRATLASAVLVPVMLSAASLIAAFTWSAEKSVLRFLAVLIPASLAVGLLRVVLARGKPAFHRRLWQAPMYFLIGGGLAFLVPCLWNLSSAEPPRHQMSKVISSWPDDAGIFEIWELELEGVGEVKLPVDVGSLYKKDDLVAIEWTKGALGWPRLLKLEPAARP